MREDEHHHPKIVCQPCYMKLKRDKKKLDKKKGGTVSSWNVPEFKASKKRSHFSCFLEDAASIAEQYGFIYASTETVGAFAQISPEAGEILIRFKVLQDYTWTVQYKEKFLPPSSSIFTGKGKFLKSLIAFVMNTVRNSFHSFYFIDKTDSIIF